MRKYPIGIQSFSKLRRENYLYIDKTKFVGELTGSGSVYFLSRPRRFGKSLFVDMMECAFSGHRELFRGLYLENNWDWDKTYPVLKISFGSGVHRNGEELRQTIRAMLNRWRRIFKIDYENQTLKDCFAEIIEKLAERYNAPVVVLIDEYDKPILDNITNTPLAVELREELKNLYSVLKDADQYLKFVFITGVSKFSKVSLFSGLNNLEDITINPRYSALCGYTQEELELYFAEELKLYDKEQVRNWYNGFSWGNGTVYNPFDILLFFDSGVFRNYWFESGTPRFLLKLLEENHYFMPDLEYVEASEAIAESFEIEDLAIETLLFQTGYLTVKEIIQLGARRTYALTYPNLEVKMSLNDALLGHLSRRQSAKEKNIIRLYRLLQANDFEQLKELFHSFFAAIPHDWFRKNSIEEYEGFYASVFYAYFCALGLEVKAEDTTSRGRIDMTVFFENRCYIFEFKLAGGGGASGNALRQIKDRRYAEKYHADFAEIYLVGVEFDKTSRNITAFEFEQYSINLQ
jgi:hypothetical protein